MLKHAILWLALAAGTHPAFADGLDKGRIAADAQWVAHVDVEAILGSALFEIVTEMDRKENGGEGELERGLAEIEAETGLRAERDVLSLTIYGSSAPPTDGGENAVVLVSTTDVVDALASRLNEIDGYRPIQVGSYVVHAFGDRPGKEELFGYVHRVRGTSKRVLVLARDRERLIAGIGVLEGTAPSLAKPSNTVLQVRPAAGTMLYVAARHLDELAHLDPTSRVARLARSLEFEFGEERETLFARLAVEAEDTDRAQQITDVLRGITAMAGLVSATAAEDTPLPIQDLVRAIRFQSNGAVVSVSFSYGARKLAEDIEELSDY
jgi:hypothetical protein